MSLHALILAAGEGKRMRSSLPKLLHPCAGRPLVAHAVAAATGFGAESVTLVVGAHDDELRAAVADDDLRFAVQEQPTGTADAIAAGIADLDDAAAVVVINGDCPGVRTSTLARFADGATGADAAVLAVRPDDRAGYGRLLRDKNGNLRAIIEEADADESQRAIGEVNGGIYFFNVAAVRGALDAVSADNKQAERYATHLFAILSDGGADVRVIEHEDGDEVHGVNSRAELARAERLLQRRKVVALMESGVSVRDPERTYVDVDVEVGVDTTLHAGVILEGNTVIGSGCNVRAGTRIADSRIGNAVNVLDGCIIEESVVDDGASLGPYARLRPASEIGAGAKVGNFVETKATRLGAGSKAGHLSYLGNARIGNNVNIGAGTITCNYDGTNKHETVIDDGAFIGSNTSLVAPVRIGANAYVAAGSTITFDVPANALGIGRGRQVNKEHWDDQKGSR